jgi:hypothetical protein
MRGAGVCCWPRRRGSEPDFWLCTCTLALRLRPTPPTPRCITARHPTLHYGTSPHVALRHVTPRCITARHGTNWTCRCARPCSTSPRPVTVPRDTMWHVIAGRTCRLGSHLGWRLAAGDVTLFNPPLASGEERKRGREEKGGEHYPRLHTYSSKHMSMPSCVGSGIMPAACGPFRCANMCVGLHICRLLL